MAHRRIHSDDTEEARIRPKRSGSLSSEVISASGMSSGALPPSVSQPPVYIAALGAAQLLSAEVRETVGVSISALALVNGFLDQILFDILRTASSNALPQLRSAIPLVLKPRLGKIALKAADDELREYLEDSDDDQQQSTVFPRRGDFNLDLAWKLARLRCMVYTRLGDLEEEDEEEIIEEEGLEHDSDGTRSASHLGPASAIFLTSILEFIGEQALYYAAQSAQKRSQRVAQQEGSNVLKEPNSADHPQLVIEEADMSQIGRESSLSRLWRSWKRSARSVREPVSRPLSPEMAMNTQPGSPTDLQAPRSAGLASVIRETPDSIDEESLPAQIPLPMSSRDVDEIEVPGLAPELDGPAGESLVTPDATKRRPKSMMYAYVNKSAILTPESVADTAGSSEATRKRPRVKHTRSSSVPTPAQSPLTIPRRANETTTFGQFPVPPREDDYAATNKSETSSQNSRSGDSENETNENAGKHDSVMDSISHGHPERPATALNDHDDRQVGKVAAALSAVAGTLGLSAAANYLQPLHQPDTQESISDQRSVDDNLSSRSLATDDTNNGVTNAGGASLAHSGALDGAPTAIPQRRKRDRAEEVSDPEDLALSSEEEDDDDDEKDMIRRSPVFAPSQNAGNSAPTPINSPGSFLHDAETSDEEEVLKQNMPASVHSSPSSRKRPADYAAKAINRQAVVISHPRHDDEDEQSLEYHDAASRQRASGQDSQSMTFPAQDRGDTTASSPTQPVSARDFARPTEQSDTEDIFGPRYSTTSGVRPSAAHAANASKSSARTQHSKSSSSSSQLLGFDREQQLRASGVFPVGNEPNNTGIASMAKSKKPSHLRLRTDDELEEDENKKKSLEMLIRSDETLHYTLTPSSARAEQFTIPSKPKTQTQELADFFRDTKPPADDPARSKLKKNNVPTGLNGLRANPASTGPPPTQQKYIPSSKSVPPTPTTSKTKSSLGSPREARVERDNIRDLADYARSTGPDGPGQLPKALPSATAQSKSGSSTGTTSARPSTGSRTRFLARDATVSRHAESSELIDFIREGPPRVPGDHRIDRKVAPFRTTMDSDDLNGIAPERNADHNGTASVASTQNSSVARSMQSSVTSRTALLESSNRNKTQAAAPTKQPASMTLRQSALAGDGTPKRTRRRVRDPYAISDSEDDDLEETAPPPKTKTQEESLIDFLRNTAPPPNMTTRPIMTSDSSTTSSSTIRPQSSNPGLKDRLLHTATMNGMNRKMSNSTRPKRDAEAAPPTTTYTNNAARPESPHLTQMGSKLDTYRPTKPTHASIMERNRQRSKIEAREPRTGGNTSDLADYLRSSGPPPSAKVGGEAKEDEDAMKEQAGFRKFFGRNRSVKS